MATHKEIRDRKQAAKDFAFDIVRKRGTVRLNDLHAFFGDVWKHGITFIQEIKKVVPDDIIITTKQKVGTIATFAPEKAAKLAVIRNLPAIVEARQEERKTRTIHGKNKEIIAKRKAAKAARKPAPVIVAPVNNMPKHDSKGRFVKRQPAA